MNKVLELSNQESSKPSLGRLVRVDLRTMWAHEERDFSQWLKSPENMELLAETLEIGNLEVIGTEVPVGGFSADIVCRELDSNRIVVIENQLEDTDHKHLGQLLTYIAGVKGSTVVWVAANFREEHRAAFDMLNANTTEALNFFGVEIELWRIGESDLAPRFNIVCKPNGWSKRLSEAASQSKIMTETKQSQLDYWQALNDYLHSRSRIIRPRKANAQHWSNFSIGSSDFALCALMNTKNKLISVQLEIAGTNAKTNFKQLLSAQQQIETEIGESLEWRELPDKARSYIQLELSSDPFDQSLRGEQYEWFLRKLEAFYKTFAPRIRKMQSTASLESNGLD